MPCARRSRALKLYPWPFHSPRRSGSPLEGPGLCRKSCSCAWSWTTACKALARPRPGAARAAPRHCTACMRRSTSCWRRAAWGGLLLNCRPLPRSWMRRCTSPITPRRRCWTPSMTCRASCWACRYMRYWAGARAPPWAPAQCCRLIRICGAPWRPPTASGRAASGASRSRWACTRSWRLTSCARCASALPRRCCVWTPTPRWILTPPWRCCVGWRPTASTRPSRWCRCGTSKAWPSWRGGWTYR